MLNVMTLERLEQHTSDYYYNDIDFYSTPVIALSSRTRKILSNLLDRKKLLLSDDGNFRDYRGLAVLTRVDNSHGALIETNSTHNILRVWEQRSIEEANLGLLQSYLGKIDRWDVVDDTNAMFSEDARIFLTQRHKEENKRIRDVLPGTEESYGVYNNADDYECLTNDDVRSIKYGLPLVTYDAFVLYADEDLEFAATMVDKLELMNFKLCTKDRDLLPGVQFKYEAIIHLITKRCNRLIVIVSPAFLRSHANKFLLNYTQSLGIEQGRSKIIPCLYESCQLPDTLRFYFVLSYLRSGHLYNFWDKLRDALEYAALNGLRNNAITLSVSMPAAFGRQPRQAIEGATAQRLNSIESHGSLERKRKENLSKMKTKDRAIIQEINSTVQIHRSTSQTAIDRQTPKIVEDSVEVKKMFEKLPSPPTASPIAKQKSFSMWDINKASASTGKSESVLSKSQLNLNGNSTALVFDDNSKNNTRELICNETSQAKSPSSSSALRTLNWFKRITKSKECRQNGDEPSPSNGKVKKKKSGIFTKKKLAVAE